APILPLAELEPLPRSRAARLLPFYGARIASQQSVFAQLFAMPLIRLHQRSGDREAQRAGLAGIAAAIADRFHVERAQRVGRDKRLLNVRHERRTREVITQRPSVDIPLP